MYQRMRTLGLQTKPLTSAAMNQLRVEEYRALRETIRARGGLRLALCLFGLVAWALTLVAVLAWLPNPIAGSIPLLLLISTFEINRILHLGVERIGRYLQVFYEDREAAGTETPAWEHTAMSFGPTVPGAGGHAAQLPDRRVARPRPARVGRHDRPARVVRDLAVLRGPRHARAENR
jgi:hypothetical protein